ncbi:MAG: IS607 family transposase [Terrimicrobiaceae bacterium]
MKIKLSVWAKKNGLGYRTAFRLFKSGKFPAKTQQLPTGTILVEEVEEAIADSKLVIYARVSSHDQKDDLQRQLTRLRDFCSSNGWKISSEIAEVASGMNDSRKGLLSVLRDKTIQVIVVEHRDRLTRFGFNALSAVLGAENRKVVIINEKEFKEDIVQDLIDIMTSMCAKIYGKRGAKNKAKKALEAIARE